ncbi:MAG: MAPEG family protein [Burkholderiales bacterium]|nr:MAPEG family protein [Burkholderiales bacterium]
MSFPTLSSLPAAVSVSVTLPIAVFAPLVLLALMTGRTGQATAVAASVFFFARLGHFFSYTMAIPAARVILFLVGWGATMVIALSLFGVLA